MYTSGKSVAGGEISGGCRADETAGDQSLAGTALHDYERLADVKAKRGVERERPSVEGGLDEANAGANPLGFSSDAIAFDIDPTLLGVGSTAQVGTRAVQGLTE